MRFTIRDLLWLTVVVALAVAWRIDRSRLINPLEENGGVWIRSIERGETLLIGRNKKGEITMRHVPAPAVPRRILNNQQAPGQ